MKELPLQKIARLAAEIGAMKEEFKRRSMIFDCEAKERVAMARGLPFDAYHDLSFNDWIKLKREQDVSI